jgi:hypothetical protein
LPAPSFHGLDREAEWNIQEMGDHPWQQSGPHFFPQKKDPSQNTWGLFFLLA